ncbi:MAG: sigma 54-interacting transcriptional regulator [Desulfobacterales bacterium]|jgi:propionate catabolism operon transcriptional regulator|nr:sigma 54-interacting transcriptional regulator [Desulfobacterales bacterium]
MSIKKVNLGIFASSPSLMGRIEALGAHRQIRIEFDTHGLDDAVPIAAEMERQGIEVVVGRRGTAHLLRENLRIPVLSFPHRSLDILISLKAAARIGRRVLFPVFRQEMTGIGILEELLDIELIQKIYRDAASLEKAVTRAKRRGCDVVVGGGVTQRIAESIGLKFVEIRTSDEDIAATLDNAVSVALGGREQKAVAQRYRAIIDAASDGLVAVDAAGRVTAANAAARKALKIGENDALGRPVLTLLPESPVLQVLGNRSAIHDRLGQIRDDRFIFNHLPILLDGEAIGAVSTFRDIGNVMRTESVVRRSLSAGLVAKYKLKELVHVSPAMREVVELGRQYARTESTILVIGETGTGKEIFAQGIHDLSRRTRFPFVSINCAALPEQLLESELFGHEEGAFTGSKRGGKPGRFELAHQGTIFLDEIDSTPEAMQVRLLRVLQEREVMRVGGDRIIPVDVRVIAAASRDLTAALQEGSFRADLFFRLNVLRIQIPPLRQRQEDIPVLLDFFIRMFSGRQQIEPIRLPPAYIDLLQQCAWPGNVRQLKNFAERLVLNCSLRCSPDMLEILYRELIQFSGVTSSGSATAVPHLPTPLRDHVRETALQSERAIILEALQDTRYRLSRTAEHLGISRTTLWRKMKALGLG